MGQHVKHIVKHCQTLINIILCFVIIHIASQHTIEYNQIVQTWFVLGKFMLAAKNQIPDVYVFGNGFKGDFSL